MDALYAFMRLSDDLADEPSEPVPGEPPAKRAALAAWRQGLAVALDGHSSHPIHPALVDTIHRYSIPPRYLFEALDGVERDLDPVHFATFAELYPYCYRVASTVGLACVRIWGLRPGAAFAEADEPAEAAGIAFQLTNILRDLGEDLARGRVYLPADELARAQCPPESWRDPSSTACLGKLIETQVERARHYFRRSEPLGRLLSNDGRGIFQVMSGLYRRILDEVARAGAEVVRRRVRVPKWRKGLALLGGWRAKWGWL